MVGNVEELDEVWEMLDTCYNHSEKCTAKALDPIIKFQRYNIYIYNIMLLLRNFIPY